MGQLIIKYKRETSKKNLKRQLDRNIENPNKLNGKKIKTSVAIEK